MYEVEVNVEQTVELSTDLNRYSELTSKEEAL
jgi:hypothetical protein